MQAGIDLILMTVLALNLSHYGPPELRGGTFWKYRMGDTDITMLILDASPVDGGTYLELELSRGGKSVIPGWVLWLAPDRKGAGTWQTVLRLGDGKKTPITFPEFKAGTRWTMPKAPGTPAAFRVKSVAPAATSTPAGQFPNAIRVSLAVEGEPDEPEEDTFTLWIARGVGLLAAGEPTTRFELLDYGPREPAAVPAIEPGQSEDPPVKPALPAGKPDAMALLKDAERAFREAKSVHVVERGVGMSAERYFSSRSIYWRATTPDGDLYEVGGLDVDAGQWWTWDADERILYTADIKPFASRLADCLSRWRQRGRVDCAPLSVVYDPDLDKATKSVAVLTRKGRKVAAVTVLIPKKVRSEQLHRKVLDVDLATKRLMKATHWGKLDGADEERELYVETLKYDAPPPRRLTTPPRKQAARIEVMTAAMEKANGTVWLTMKTPEGEVRGGRMSFYEY